MQWILFEIILKINFLYFFNELYSVVKNKRSSDNQKEL